MFYCARKINVTASANVGSDAKEVNYPRHVQTNGLQRESKLELFGFDSLVNILGLRRYAALCYCIQLIFFLNKWLFLLPLQTAIVSGLHSVAFLPVILLY